MGARTGSQFLDGLRKTKREIWVDGEKIADVTAHPKLRGGAESLAAIFDRQHAWAADCLFTHPDSGQPVRRVPIGGTGLMGGSGGGSQSSSGGGSCGTGCGCH